MSIVVLGFGRGPGAGSSTINTYVSNIDVTLADEPLTVTLADAPLEVTLADEQFTICQGE